MTRASLSILMSLGTGLLLAACGDDSGTSGNGASTGESSTESTTSTTDPINPPTTGVTGDMTTGQTSGGMTESASSTVDPSTGEPTESGTTGETTTGNIGTTGEPDTTTVTPETTTGETTTGETTTGDDTTTGEMTTGNAEDCLLAQQHEPCDKMSNDALHAMGLNCTSLGDMWVNNSNAVTVTGLDFQAPPPMNGERSWQVAKSYGSFIDPDTKKPFWGPREGEKFLMISSGLLPTPNGQGAVIIANGDVYNDTAFGGVWDSDSMPPPMSAQKGSPDPMGYTNCDGVNDCSNTILDQWNLGFGNAEDKMWFSFNLKAPAIANGDVADANGYTFNFAYFSAEFPEYVDSQFNDIFVVWQSSEDYTGNVTFINGQPMTVTALWPIDFQGGCDFFDPNCQGNDPHLAGTGHSMDGGATNWYKATGGIKPGETFLLAFAVFDMGDSSFDTTALLDNWQWDCEGCVPNEVMSCGIEPM